MNWIQAYSLNPGLALMLALDKLGVPFPIVNEEPKPQPQPQSQSQIQIEQPKPKPKNENIIEDIKKDLPKSIEKAGPEIVEKIEEILLPGGE